MSFHLRLEIPTLPKLPNQYLRGHWRNAHSNTKKWKKLVLIHVGNKRPLEPLLKSELVLTRHSSSEPDFDGLVGSFKAIIDGLKECGVIFDDKSKFIKTEYLWKKVAPKKGFVTIDVLEK